MGTLTLLSMIPWDTIFKYSPMIVESGQKIFSQVNKYFGNTLKESSKSKKISLEQLDKRIKLLEQNELDQADLNEKIAVQIKELSIAAKIISNRTLLALSISSLSLIVSFVLLVIIVVR
jgi:predicted PurR-regulated permease PerM